MKLMNDKPEAKRPRKRWKRVLKWTTGAILVVLLLAFLAGFIAYWRSTNDCGQTAAPANPMKAVVYCDYGIRVLKLRTSKSRRLRTINCWSSSRGIVESARWTLCARNVARASDGRWTA